MIKEIKLPEISESAETGTVTEILVSEGDHIEEEQSIIAVETDKASVEIPAEEGGEVREIKVATGDEVETGTVILTVETEEEAEKEEVEEKESAEAEKEKEKEEPEVSEEEEEEEKKREKEEEPATARREGEAAPPDEASKEEVPAAPSVRRLARELGVDIYEVEGTGPGNRITADDVKAYAREMIRGEGAAALSEEAEMPDFSQWGDISREKISNIRKTTAQNTARSWRKIPHVTHFDEADMTLAESFMEDHAEEVEAAGGKLTVTALLVKLAAEMLKRFPVFNASLDLKNEEIIYKKYIHIGLAVDTDRGLLVPVLRDADQKSITQIAVEITELAEKARNQKLSPEAMQGGNFIVTNLGGIGGTNFTPIIYHPQVAILGVSRASVKPVYSEEGFKPRSLLPLSLSYDHRIIDGATAARFMRRLCDVLQNPLSLFMENDQR